MKLSQFLNIVNYFSAVLFVSLSLLSCQDEDTEITNPEPSEVLEIDSSLTSLIKRTVSSEDSEDSIECINFEYPISISIFSTSFDVANTEEINSDIEFSSFLETLENDVVVSINYPITTIFANESIPIEINGNLGLEGVLLDGEGSNCSNSIQIQDCTQTSATENFLNCKWNINNYSPNNEFENYTIIFAQDNTLSIFDDTDTAVGGDWEVFEDGDQLMLKIDTQLISITWGIVECDDDFVQASGDNETIILAKNCSDNETEESPEITASKEILSGKCSWVMDRYNVDGVSLFSNSITARIFQFFDDGTFTFTDATTTYEGTWDIEANDDGSQTITIDSDQSLPDYINYNYTIDTLRDGFTLWEANDTEEEIITGFEAFCN